MTDSGVRSDVDDLVAAIALNSHHRRKEAVGDHRPEHHRAEERHPYQAGRTERRRDRKEVPPAGVERAEHDVPERDQPDEMECDRVRALLRRREALARQIVADRADCVREAGGPDQQPGSTARDPAIAR